MSKALKCDRCGFCFDPLVMPEKKVMVSFSNPIFRNSKDAAEHTVRITLLPKTLETVDLCPRCGELFRCFMKGCPLANNIYADEQIVYTEEE